MAKYILNRALGDSVNLRILSFFAENPFDYFNISEIAEFAEVSRNTVYKYIKEFSKNGYLLIGKSGSFKGYKFDRSNELVKIIYHTIKEIRDIYLKPMRIEVEEKETPVQIPEQIPNTYNYQYRNLYTTAA